MSPTTSDPSLDTVDTALTPSLPAASATNQPASEPAAGGRIHRLAAVMHQTIDKVGQGLQSRTGSVSSLQGKYGQQARDYGDKLRGQINARPLQSAGIAVGTGVLLNKVFSRKPQVRVVHVPVATRPAWDQPALAARPARRWSDAARSHVRGLRSTGHEALGKAGAIAGIGVVGTKAMAATLARGAGALPGEMRRASHRLLDSSQRYGRKAQSGVRAHPMVGLGAMAAVGALVTTAWLQRRRKSIDTPPLATESSSTRYAGPVETQGTAGAMIAARPVTAAVLMLGVGALLGAALRSR